MYDGPDSDGNYIICVESGVYPPIADFKFIKGNSESDAKVWEYTHSCTGTEGGASVSVEVTGGALST